MKIIKEGKIPESEIPKFGLFYKGKCEKCGCEFEANENDLYIRLFEEKDYVHKLFKKEDRILKTLYILIKCPTCGNEICTKIINIADITGGDTLKW